jgi:hypothetical protein
LLGQPVVIEPKSAIFQIAQTVWGK